MQRTMKSRPTTASTYSRAMSTNGLVEGTQDGVKRATIRLLGWINATSFMETLFMMTFVSQSVYLWVRLMLTYDISFDVDVTLGISCACFGLMFFWGCAIVFNFYRYVRGWKEKLVNSDHYYPIIVHLCFAALSSAQLILLSLIYKTRYVQNSNLVEVESGYLVRNAVFFMPILLMPVEVCMWFSNVFIHRNPVPYVDVQTLFAN